MFRHKSAQLGIRFLIEKIVLLHRLKGPVKAHITEDRWRKSPTPERIRPHDLEFQNIVLPEMDTSAFHQLEDTNFKDCQCLHASFFKFLPAVPGVSKRTSFQELSGANVHYL